MQGVATNFGIDIFIPIIQAIRRELRLPSEPCPLNPDINAIADHIRAVTFAISDGVYPSNEERGFVIRKLIRKSTQRAQRIRPGTGPFLYKIVPSVARVMKEPYPELEQKREIISQIIKSEEERFQAVIKDVVPALKEEFNSVKAGGAKVVPGAVVFRYSDEKGVPFDFQREIAQEMGLGLDMDGFDRLMEEQKNRARAKSKISKEIFAAPAGLARKADEEWSEEEKLRIRANHTATHLLHAALRKVLGAHVWQSGSLVYPDRLRFDFSHPKKLEAAEIQKIEELVNNQIAAGHEVKREVMKLADAKQSGAIALFGEKYEDEVVVRTIGDFSKELCGGDHIDNTKNIGVFKILQEGSIAAGTRRIEAITGPEAYKWLTAQAEKFKAVMKPETDGWLKTKSSSNFTYADLKKWYGLETELSGLIEELSAAKKKMAKEETRQAEAAAGKLVDELLKNSREIKGVRVAAHLEKDIEPVVLRKIGEGVIQKDPAAIALVAGTSGDKTNLVLAAGRDAVKKGLNARELIKPLAAVIGGSGGGRPEFAQAGGEDASRIKEALEMIYKLVEEKL
jgi:alanyl-tRNA synthetase